MTLGTTKSSVYPSAPALAALAWAMLPPAPGWFSTMFGWPTRSPRLAATMRVTTSAGPPGAKGTSQRIGFVGQSCAKALDANRASNAVASLMRLIIALTPI